MGGRAFTRAFASARGSRLIGLLAAAFWALTATAAETWVVAPTGAPRSLQEALGLAKDGDTIELTPGDYTGGVLIENRRLTIRGMGKRPAVKGGAKPGTAKALWTVRGGEVTIENIAFNGARASDGEAAGVRQEGGKLLLRGCQFHDNEYGVFAAAVDGAELRIENSEFGMAPKVVGGLYHLLNVGRISKLSITGSRFQQGFEGHLIKSRARESLIAYNFIHDGQRGGASHAIDLPAGGVATIVGNVIGRGADGQSAVVMTYGSEGRPWDKNTLRVAHNTFINYGWLPAWFLRVSSDKLPAPSEVVAINNLIVGTGVFSWGASGLFEGNRHATFGMLRDAETYAFELAPGSMWRHSGADPRNVRGHDLSPQAEFEWPTGVRLLPGGRDRWSPGAFQR